MIEVVTPPASEPVSLTEAKLHLRVDSADDDALITGLIKTAREHVEDHTGRALVTQQLILWLDRFPCSSRRAHLPIPEHSYSVGNTGLIYLPRSPVASVDKVSYLDPTTGVLTEFDSSKYRLVDKKSLRPRLTPEYDQSWPDTRDVTNAVKIEMTCGVAADAVDETYKSAIKVLLKELYDNRSNPNMKVADALLSSKVVPKFQ